MLQWLNAELQPGVAGPSKPGTTEPYPLTCASAPSVEHPTCHQQSGDQLGKLDRQMTRLKEKNRRSATRYRGRQRQLKQTVQQQLESLETQMQQMRVQQAAMEARNRQLTAEVSRQGQQLHAATVAAVPTTARACSNGCKDGWKEDTALQDRFGDLMQVTGPVTFSVRDPALHLSIVQVAEMSEADREGLYQEYQKALASRLLQAAVDAAPQRLVQLVWEASHVLLAMLAAAHQPALELPPNSPAAAVFGATSNSTPSAVQAQDAANSCPEPETPPISRAAFLQAVQSAGLTDKQRAAIVALRARRLLHLGLLTSRRTALTAVLREAVPACGHEEECDVSAKFKRSLAAAAGLCEALRGTLTSTLEFNVLVWRRVLSARQVAFLTVAAWPAALDTISLAEALAADAGAPSTADLAAAGALQPTPLLEDVLPRAEWPAWEAPDAHSSTQAVPTHAGPAAPQLRCVCSH